MFACVLALITQTLWVLLEVQIFHVSYAYSMQMLLSSSPAASVVLLLFNSRLLPHPTNTPAPYLPCVPANRHERSKPEAPSAHHQKSMLHQEWQSWRDRAEGASRLRELPLASAVSSILRKPKCGTSLAALCWSRPDGAPRMLRVRQALQHGATRQPERLQNLQYLIFLGQAVQL